MFGCYHAAFLTTNTVDIACHCLHFIGQPHKKYYPAMYGKPKQSNL